MIIMSVDLGKVRTGLAVCDERETLAFPKEVIIQRDETRLVETICQRAEQYGAEQIVVGLPRNMDGSYGERAQECKAIGERIAERSGLPVVMQDERGTTITAHTMLNDTNTRGKKRKNAVDAVAATIILQDYLNSRSK